MDLTPKALRAEFHKLTGEANKIRAKVEPLRQRRDKHIADAKAVEDKLSADIRKLEAPLFDLDNQRATLVRALGGRTGDPNAE